MGRYALYGEIASGGVASVHFGRLLGAGGFTRTVAIKRMHPRYANDPEWVTMFLDEARLVTRIRHPNVVPMFDVVSDDRELFLVMEYIPGETLSRLIRPLAERGERVPPRIACGLVAGVLSGLHAAHEAKTSRGEPLGIVHRDVSPHNVLVGVDGVARLLDFGLAKAAIGRLHHSREGEIKGTLAYMAPEQLRGEATRRTDVYATGLLLWEALTGRRLFTADSEAELLAKIDAANIDPPSRLVLGVPREIDQIVLRALQREPAERYATAKEMARDLDACLGGSAVTEIGDWVEKMAGPILAHRASMVAAIERDLATELEAAQLPPMAQTRLLPASEPGGPVRTQSDRTAEPMAMKPRSGRRAGKRRRLGLLLVLYALVGFGLVGLVSLLVLLGKIPSPGLDPSRAGAARGSPAPAPARDASRD